MPKYGAVRNWAAPIALSAIVLVVAGGAWSLGAANRQASAAASSCGAFAGDAQKMFDKGDTAALTGTFAPGDRVHLAIDFNGDGYAWELTGAIAKTPNVTGTGWYKYTTDTRYETHTRTFWSPWAPLSTWSTQAHGSISGTARLELEIDVVRPGAGAITITKTGSAPSPASPSVAIARCKASRPPTV